MASSENPRFGIIEPVSLTTSEEGIQAVCKLTASDHKTGQEVAEVLAEMTGATEYALTQVYPKGEQGAKTGTTIGFSRNGWKRATWEPSGDVARRAKQAERRERALQQRQPPPGNPRNN